MMVETFPVKELFDLEYTGKLEKTLADIEKAKFQKEDFLKMIKAFTAQSVKTIKEDKIFASKVAVTDAATGKTDAVLPSGNRIDLSNLWENMFPKKWCGCSCRTGRSDFAD